MAKEFAQALKDISGTTLDPQGAANAWAGTTNVDLLGALNIKAGTSGVGWDQTIRTLNTNFPAFNAETGVYE
jgi:hypothetical protein